MGYNSQNKVRIQHLLQCVVEWQAVKEQTLVNAFWTGLFRLWTVGKCLPSAQKQPFSFLSFSAGENSILGLHYILA